MTSYLRSLVQKVNDIFWNLCSYSIFNMKKRKLPRNWVVNVSKTHPDRIYYFNVKTNQSTWKEPVFDANNESSEPVRKQRKYYDEEGVRSRARTPECDLTESKSVQQPSLRNRKSSKKAKEKKKTVNNCTNRNSIDCVKKCKEELYLNAKKSSVKLNTSSVSSVETSQMKALREKMMQRRLEKPAVRKKCSNYNQDYNLSPPLSENSSTYNGSNKTTRTSVLSSKRSHSTMMEDDTILSSRSISSTFSKNISLNQNDKTAFTPQMRSLHEKIQRRSGAFGVDKATKKDLKDEQELSIVKQTIANARENQEKNKPNGINNWNKHGIKQKQNIQTKKNLAQERMQKLRRSLAYETQKYENGKSIVTEMSERLNKTLPDATYSGNMGSICNNTWNRLKRLHNKVLRATKYENNNKLNNDELKIQQNNVSIVTNNTKDELIEQVNQEVLYEEMDWEPMKDEEITLEVEVVRTQLNSENCENVLNYSLENTIVLTQPGTENLQEKGPLYIVIDTNVFLANLEIIEQAKDISFKTYPRPFIVIPWTVIRELDYLKDDKSRSEALRIKARKAISFINDQFASKHPRIIGQTREQAVTNKLHFSIDCPDDEILQCCLQIKTLNKDPVLLSYDKNLCTKAMIHSITILGRHDPLEKLEDTDASMNPLNNQVQHCFLSEELYFSDELFEDAKLIMKDFFSEIIVKQMAKAFGSEWEVYVIIKPPWTVVTALKCIIKHWIAAINESFQKYAEPIARELLEKFKCLPIGGRKLQDVEYILEKCIDIIQAVSMDKHYELGTQSFTAIMELKEKCLKYIADIDQKKLLNKIGIIENIEIQEQKAEKMLQCFMQIYNYARDLCGLAATIAGNPFPLNYNALDPPLSCTTVKRLQPDITKKVTNLSNNLNKLLTQAENNSIKYQTLVVLQQDVNTFLAYIQKTTVNVELLDIYCCVKLKEEILKIGLRQLQELSTHYRALYLTTCI